MAWTNYGASKIIDQNVNWSSATIKFLLLTSAYSAANTKASVDFLNDITAFEVTGVTGYVRKTIAGASISVDNTNNIINLKTNVNYTMTITGTITFKYLAVYVDVGGLDSTRIVLAIKDKGADQSLTDDTLTISFSSDNVLQFTN